MQEKQEEARVAHYKFEYKEGSGSWQLGTEGNDTNPTKTVTFSVPKDNTTYTLRVTVTDGAGNVGTSTGSYNIKTQIANTPPRITQNTYSADTTTMTIYVTATDDEQTNLTYNLYWNGSSSVTQTKKETKEKQVTFTVSTAMYTDYNWSVIVLDGAEGEAIAENLGKTYCSGAIYTCNEEISFTGCSDCSGATFQCWAEKLGRLGIPFYFPA